MTTSRYSLRETIKNTDNLYKEIFKDRGIKFAVHYETPVLRYPTEEEIRQLNAIKRIWSYGDTYQKYASIHYGDPELWWVIGWFNKKPADFMFKTGDTVFIPTPLEFILDYYGV